MKPIFQKIKFPMEGEILPTDIGGKIGFDSADLKTAIHGIRKIEYKAELKKTENLT